MTRVAECRPLERSRRSPMRLVTSGWMVAEAEFGVKYDGPALSEGLMPVSELAPALLALGKLFAEASAVVDAGREPPSLNIKATERGSFDIWLSLQSPDAWNHVMTLLTGKAITALNNLQGIIYGAGGLFWLMRCASGRPVASRERLDNGRVKVTFPDGTTYEALPEALALYERETARLNARRVIEPLRREGIERLEFTRDAATELVIDEDDVGAFDESPLDEDVLDERIEETFVTVTTVSFVPNYKWRLNDGGRNITADFADEAFRERIRERKELFGDGDRLKVRMRVVQKETADGKLKTERTILEVLEHEPRKQYPQERFDVND